ncbi:MAG TPA: response regulator [Steroidobacteraceae bacterium]|nr:response regulator [Steroidobacteraceae bacterium]
MSHITHPRLLIVDDDPAQMRALCTTLELEGYPSTGYTSARQALSAFDAHQFDLVLTDLTMPDMNGIEFLRTLRERDPTVIGIVMTGQGTIDSAVAAMKAGALDYILKPFTLRMIVPVLDRAYTVRSLRKENVELRETEELIRNMNLSLEACVRDRTQQLMDANKELDAFTHSISHDLRAPLRAIDGFSRLLADHYSNSLDTQGRDYLDRVLQSTKRMEQLIEDLMRLSRISQAELHRRDVDLTALAQEILDELRSNDRTRVVDTVVASGMHCHADPRLLRIALENLLGNAWKFTAKTSPARIDVGSDRADRFYVRDNGAGFDSNQASGLFSPFRRLHSAAEFAGTGVGLSIVQRIIRRHGGRVDAQAAPGRGATFLFTLPQEDSAGEHSVQ